MSTGLTGSKVPVVDLKKTGENIRKKRNEMGISVRELQGVFGFANPQSSDSWQDGNSRQWN